MKLKGFIRGKLQKQPPRGVLNKRCSDNMQQNYRRATMPKCDFNKVANLLHIFIEQLWMAASETSNLGNAVASFVIFGIF